MNHFTIYHNPRCSKSREALSLLQTHHITPIIVNYLKAPLNLDQIKKLKTYFDLKDFVRQNEYCFKDLKLSLDNEDAILDALVKHPILMQRPIVTYGNKAVIGRPTENILMLINDAKRQF